MENLWPLRVLDDAGRAYTRAASRTVWLSLALSTTGSLFVFFFCPRRSHFGFWNLFFVPRVSGSPLFCVCVSLEKYRILDSGRRPLENVSVFCAMLGSTADTCSYVSLQRLFVIFFVTVDSDPELAALVGWTTPGVVTPVKLHTVWLLQVFLSASSLQVRVALCAGNLVLLSAQQLVVATPRIPVAVVD